MSVQDAKSQDPRLNEFFHGVFPRRHKITKWTKYCPKWTEYCLDWKMDRISSKMDRKVSKIIIDGILSKMDRISSKFGKIDGILSKIDRIPSKMSVSINASSQERGETFCVEI